MDNFDIKKFLIENRPSLSNKITENRRGQTNEFARSIFTLAKYNNGYFKSEKQAAYLIKLLDRSSGHITNFASPNPRATTQTSVYAQWDNEGITTITKISGDNKSKKILFQRSDNFVAPKSPREIRRETEGPKLKAELDDLNKKINHLKGVIDDKGLHNDPVFVNLLDDLEQKYKRALKKYESL